MKKLVTKQMIFFLLFIFLLISFCFISNNFLNFKLFLDGESSSLLNIPLNLLNYNNFNYELADIYKYADLNTFSMHPPLFYYLNYVLFNFIDFYPKSAYLLNLTFSILIFIIIFFLNSDKNESFGIKISIFSILICLQQQIFFRNLISFRPEILLGFINFILMMLLSVHYRKILINICIGIFLAFAIASHWLGFFSLLICSGILLVRKKSFQFNKILLINNLYISIGFILVILCWNYFYENQLFQHFYLSYKFNGLNLNLIQHTFLNNFIFKILKNEGIILFLIGILIQLYFLLFNKQFLCKDNFTNTLQKNSNVFFILFIFLMFFMGNKEDRYFLNIFFIGLFLSSLGYLSLIKYLYFYNKKIYIFLFSLAFIFSFLNNELRDHYFSSAKDNKKNFETLKNNLDFLENKKVLAGSTSYYFISDKNIHSTFNVIYQIFNKKLQGTDRIKEENISYLLNLYEMTTMNVWDLKEEEIKKEILNEKYEYIMISPICYWYQCLFYRNNVWSNHFDKVITVIRIRQNNFLEKIKGNIPNVYNIYKNNNYSNLINKTDDVKVICNDEFILFKHNSKIKNFNYTPENWRLINLSKRKKIILEILSSYHFENISNKNLLEIEKYIFNNFTIPMKWGLTKTRYKNSLTISQFIENILHILIKKDLKNNLACT